MSEDWKERGVRGEVEDDVLCGEFDFDAALGDVEQQQQRFVHPISGKTVQGFGNKHRARGNFAVFDALQKTAKPTILCVVATKRGDANVLQGFSDRLAVGLHEP